MDNKRRLLGTKTRGTQSRELDFDDPDAGFSDEEVVQSHSPRRTYARKEFVCNFSEIKDIGKNIPKTTTPAAPVKPTVPVPPVKKPMNQKLLQPVDPNSVPESIRAAVLQMQKMKTQQQIQTVSVKKEPTVTPEVKVIRNTKVIPATNLPSEGLSSSVIPKEVDIVKKQDILIEERMPTAEELLEDLPEFRMQ